VKIGEAAHVRLPSFTLEGAARKPLRSPINRIAREGFTFRVAGRSETARLLDELRDVSDEWLVRKGRREKGFSLGYFKESYLERFPVALLERDGQVEAFANLFLGSDHVELSPDMIRYRGTAPPGIMDALFVHMILWGKAQGYEWFDLGVAPLSGLTASPLTPVWMHLGRFVYRYGEAFYNFQGLRAYKDKFDPEWRPRYLAYPGGLALARVITDVTALIAGGYSQIFLRQGPRAA
jgi:phosphatidylglycerol lysyltransferase